MVFSGSSATFRSCGIVFPGLEPLLLAAYFRTCRSVQGDSNRPSGRGSALAVRAPPQGRLATAIPAFAVRESSLPRTDDKRPSAATSHYSQSEGSRYVAFPLSGYRHEIRLRFIRRTIFPEAFEIISR